MQLKQKVKLKKRICIFSVMFVGICFIFFKYHSEEVVYQNELTKEEKIQDFTQFYTIMCEAMPFLEEVKNTYGIDFVNRKEYYESMITSTNNNAEFYATMQAISRDLCSFHTNVCYPLYSNVKGIRGYNARKTINLKGMKETQNLWYESLGKEIKEYSTVDCVSVVYFDGEYVVVDSAVEGVSKGDRLVYVNDVSANEYLIQNLSLGYICYDGKRKNAYRTQYTFNDSNGDRVSTVWRNEQGEEFTRELKHSLMGELIMGYGYLYGEVEEQTISQTLPTVYSYRDDKKQIEYIRIADFSNNKGNRVRDIISEMKYNTVIIDLRGNYGGNVAYFQNYIYPYLYSEDFTCNQYWMTNKSKYNSKMLNNITVSFNEYAEKQNDVVFEIQNKFVGRYEGPEKNIYYLVDDGTGSAADFAAMVVKNNNLGILVGENTRGEGGAQSFICDYLGNSGLVFIYYSAIMCSEDGEKMYTPGTEPDVHIAASYEDYLEKMKYLDSEYESMVQYDPLLKWIFDNCE